MRCCCGWWPVMCQGDVMSWCETFVAQRTTLRLSCILLASFSCIQPQSLSKEKLLREKVTLSKEKTRSNTANWGIISKSARPHQKSNRTFFHLLRFHPKFVQWRSLKNHLYISTFISNIPGPEHWILKQSSDDSEIDPRAVMADPAESKCVVSQPLLQVSYKKNGGTVWVKGLNSRWLEGLW